MTDLEKTRTFYAAEAAAESAMAQLALALEDAILEDQELSSIVPPTIEGFSFDNFSVVKQGGTTTERITDGEYAGLFSITQVVDITTEAVSADYTTSSVMVTAKAQAIPIFQFGVFFEGDLEIANGPRMDFDGWVHSNGNIYLMSNNQYFADIITTPLSLYHDRKDSHGNLTGTYIADASANFVQLNFDSRDTPDPNSFRAASDAAFDNRVKTGAYGVDSLKVPLPAGVNMTVLMEPRNGADNLLERQSKFAWKADWYLEVDLSVIGTTNFMTFGQMVTTLQAFIDANPGLIAAELQDALDDVNDALVEILIPDDAAALDDLDDAIVQVQGAGLPGPDQADLVSGLNQMRANILSGGNAGGNGNGGGGGTLCQAAGGITHTRDGGLQVPTNVACANIFSWNYDMWYESRELRYVDVLDIDVNALNAWTNNANQLSTLYITISTAGAQDPRADGVYPIVRLLNAQTLDAPMTFATEHPLYTQGDYNNDPLWYPSSLIGDGLTFLSTVWNDANHQNAVVVQPAAADTDIYAAVMAGSSATPCDHEVAGCGVTSPYGGGLENFPRFLEGWGGQTLLFRGSLVSLIASQQSTGAWGCCVYYSPPIRDWKFDTRFDLPENMPPGTPVVGNVIHTAFRPVF